MGYGTAWVEQDYIRRTLLREKDKPNQPNIRLIDMTVRFALDEGYDVILEGILPAKHYKEMLLGLLKYPSEACIYYFDIPLEETFKRHATKPNSQDFGEEEMRKWYLPQDMLGVENEQLILYDSALDTTVERILKDITS